MASARILIDGIQARGSHGANPGERLRPQDFVIDLDVVVEVGGDSLDDTLDYRGLVDLARATVEGSSLVLLESLAQAIAQAIWDLSGVLEVTAAVHKPGAAGTMRVQDVVAKATIEV